MIRTRTKIVPFVAILGLSAVAFSTDSYQDLTPIQLIAHVAGEQNIWAPDRPRDDYNITGTAHKYRVRFTGTGQIRPIQKDARELIKRWALATSNGAFSELFEHEVQVRQPAYEGKATGGGSFRIPVMYHWMPIQVSLVDDWKAEIAGNVAAEVYLMWIGSVKERAIFLINGFDELTQ